MKEYIRAAKLWESHIDAEAYLARTVFEKDETYDIGLVDAAGNKILARVKANPIGFVHHAEEGDGG